MLSKKQEIFAKEYVKLDDASKAFRIAYDTSKWKDKSVHERASKLLNTAKVKSRIKELQMIAADIAEKEFKTDSRELLRHLTILRKARIDEYIVCKENLVPTTATDENGIEYKSIKKELKLEFKPFDELTEEQLMCIESIKETRNGIELKLHGKDWTIEKIAKHIGFYEAHNKQKQPTLTPEQRVAKILELQNKLHQKE